MKQIAIIGGGISGLTVLHYLKQRFNDSVDVTLYEREAQVGGTIHSIKKDSCLFEWGPNGFLDNQPASLRLIEELGIANQLIEANPKSRRRYIQINGRLNLVPTNPISLIRTPILTSNDKFSLIKGVFKKKIRKDCSIHDYISQRFSSGIAESIIDPFISGIYAGDIKRLHMASAFPKIKRRGPQKTRMRSFKGGMGIIIEALYDRYKNQIQTNAQVSLEQLKSDLIIISTPAYAAAKMVESCNPDLAKVLNQVSYAPIAVAGLLFKEDAFKRKPDGFGYLIASKEGKDVLGVLIESNVYRNRAMGGHILLRVMLGGAHHPSIINDTQAQILTKATKEIDSTYGLLAEPVEIFIKKWPQAIPQYEINYPQLRQTIAQECAKTPGLYLCANYLDGISFNDCINNAKILVGTLKF